MTQANSVHRVTIIGVDHEVMTWIRNAVHRENLPWHVRVVDPLRTNAPENQLNEQDLIILVWERTMPVGINVVLQQHEPRTRSSEGILVEFEQYGRETLIPRTVTLSRSFTREDTVLMAEMGVRTVITLPPKQSLWDEERHNLLQRMAKHLADVKCGQLSQEETVVQRFSTILGSWERLSDEKKMLATEILLRTLGDTARYAELMARKSMKENDLKGAERWLQRAIAKNPNYIIALRQLARLYMQTKRYEDSLKLLEKLKASSPRNVGHLDQIGNCYLAMGELQKADKVLSDALAIDEYYIPSRETLGKVKCLLGEHDTARQLLQMAKNRRDLALFFNDLGIELVQKKEYPRAIAHYKKAQFVLPGNENSHLLFLNMALAYYKWGKVTEALRFASLAIAREPTYEKAQKLVDLVKKLLQDREHLKSVPRAPLASPTVRK